MPKKSKDFAKQKLKVGKKQQDSKLTKVDFKSLQIRIPLQEFSQDPVKKLETTLALLTSHNSQSQIEACGVLGNFQISFLKENLATTVNGIAKSLVNENDLMRKNVLQFVSKFFQNLESDAIMPFFSIIILFCSSALTHINEKVRLDGLKLIKILCQTYPDLMHINGTRLLPNFYEMLTFNKKLKEANSKLGLMKSRDELLSSFDVFLQIIFPENHENVDENNSFRTYWNSNGNRVNLLNNDGTAFDKNLSSFKLDDSNNMHKCLGDIIPVLIDFWIESSELALENNVLEKSAHFSNCHHVLRIMWLIISQILAKVDTSTKKVWKDLLTKHIGEKFPFGRFSSLKQNQVSSYLTEMNLLYSRIILEFSNNSSETGIVARYVAEIFQDFNSNILSDVHFKWILPIIQRMSEQEKHKVIDAICEYQMKCKNRHHSYDSFKVIASIVSNSRLINAEQWILALFKQCWNLGTQDIAFSSDILKFVALALKLGILKSSEDLLTLEKYLIPLFVSNLPNRQIFGPFCKYSTEMQYLLIDVCYYLPKWSQKLVQTLCIVSRKETVSSEIIIHLLDISFHRQKLDELKLSANLFSSFVISILMDKTEKTPLINGPSGLVYVQNNVNWEKQSSLMHFVRNRQNVFDNHDFLISLLSSNLSLESWFIIILILCQPKEFAITSHIIQSFVDAAFCVNLCNQKTVLTDIIQYVSSKFLANDDNRHQFYDLIIKAIDVSKVDLVPLLFPLLIENDEILDSIDIKKEMQLFHSKFDRNAYHEFRASFEKLEEYLIR